MLIPPLNWFESNIIVYERGEREVPFWVAIKLADYYKVSLDYLAEREHK